MVAVLLRAHSQIQGAPACLHALTFPPMKMTIIVGLILLAYYTAAAYLLFVH